MKLIEEISSSISSNQEAKAALQSITYNDKLSIWLNDAKAMDTNIFGFMLFNSKNTSYSSEGIANYTSLTALREIRAVNNFLSSDNNSMWFLYTGDNNAININYEVVNPQNGIIYYMSKLHDKNNTLYGYLLCVININSFYYYFKNDNEFSSVFYTYLTNSTNNYLLSKYNGPMDNSVRNDIEKLMQKKKGSELSSNRKYLLAVNTITNSDIRVISAVSLTHLIYKQNELLLLLVVPSIMFILLFYALAVMVARSIILPLSRLYEKMQNNNLDSLY
jgi:hypothetical protein